MSYSVPFALINGRLLDPSSGLDQTGGVLIDQGLITDIGSHINIKYCERQKIPFQDCQGHCIAPGLIDMRMQVRVSGATLTESLSSTLQAAAAGGVTSMVCLPNTRPILDHAEVVSYLRHAANQAQKTKLYCYGSMTQNLAGQQLSEMGYLQQAGAIGFTDGMKAVDNPKVFWKALSYAKTFKSLILQYAEDPRLAEGTLATQSYLSTKMGLPSVPTCAESMQIGRDLHFVALTQSPYHSFPITTKTAAGIISQAKQHQLPVSCSTSPAYFCLNEQAIQGYQTLAKLSPPLREESDRLAVIEGLKNGIIDCITSDHSPQDDDSKKTTFVQSSAGAAGLETLFPLSLRLHHQHGMGLLALLKCLTSNPADILGLSQGRLQIGKPADMVVFDVAKSYAIDIHAFRGQAKNSPFHHFPVKGKILQTYVDGRQIYNNF